jgi:hypothetical protein
MSETTKYYLLKLRPKIVIDIVYQVGNSKSGSRGKKIKEAVSSIGQGTGCSA